MIADHPGATDTDHTNEMTLVTIWLTSFLVIGTNLGISGHNQLITVFVEQPLAETVFLLKIGLMKSGYFI